MSWSRPIYSPGPYLFKTSSKCFPDVLPRYLQEVFKTFSKRLPKTLSRHLQDVFKTSSRRLANTSSRCLQDIFKTSCKYIFKTFSRCIIKLNCSYQHVFEKYSTRSLDILSQRQLPTEWLAQVTLLLKNVWSVFKNYQRDKNFSNFSFSLYSIFWWLLTGAYYNLVELLQWRLFADLLNYLGSLKMVLWKIFQNSQENICIRISFFDKVCRSATLLKARLQRKCFLANVAKFIRTPFFLRTPPDDCF